MISLDGKPHDPRRALQYTYMGYTVGRWEGDTLVLDSIGFSDETWLGRGGFFHSDQMRVIEKFTRTGNQLLYEVRVEDPVVLTEPWKAAFPLQRDDPYRMFEYACHEDNSAVRNFIEASRFERRQRVAATP